MWLTRCILGASLFCIFLLTARSTQVDPGEKGNNVKKATNQPLADPEYEVVKELHHTMDGDHNGDLEESDTRKFIEQTLHQHGLSKVKGHEFHRYDAHITVEDLLTAWHSGEVYKWTQDDLVQWFIECVELPQYEDRLRELEYNGTILPWLATLHETVLETLGVQDPSDRQKIQLKAIDVVLFGSPKYARRNLLLDIILVGVATGCVVGLWWTCKTKREAERELDLVLSHMKTAEDDVKKLQERLREQDRHVVHKPRAPHVDSIDSDMSYEKAPTFIRSVSDSERSPKEDISFEIEALFLRKQNLEQELDSLQNMSDHFHLLLQQTYKKEKTHWEEMKKDAEKELHVAKKECDKLHKKKSSIFSSLRFSHSSTLHDTDMQINHAIITLKEVVEGLEEFNERWRSIERLCNVQLSDGIESEFTYDNPTPPPRKRIVRQSDPLDSGRGSTQSSLDSASLSLDCGAVNGAWGRQESNLTKSSSQDSPELQQQWSDDSSRTGRSAALPSRSISNVVSSSFASSTPMRTVGSESNVTDLVHREAWLSSQRTIPQQKGDKKHNYLVAKVSTRSSQLQDSLPAISERSPLVQKKMTHGQDEVKPAPCHSTV